jgi:hypothetical protein
MSIAGVGFSHDVDEGPRDADLLQAQYFRGILAVHRGELADDLAKHTATLSNAELDRDHWLMEYERRQMRTLEAQLHRVTAMLQALEGRFHGMVRD